MAEKSHEFIEVCHGVNSSYWLSKPDNYGVYSDFLSNCEAMELFQLWEPCFTPLEKRVIITLPSCTA